ncbi:MAG: hypothetical protein R2813_02710 [Flavobacteriales bacterium]
MLHTSLQGVVDALMADPHPKVFVTSEEIGKSIKEQAGIDYLVLTAIPGNEVSRLLLNSILEIPYGVKDEFGANLIDKLSPYHGFHPWYLIKHKLVHDGIAVFQEYKLVELCLEHLGSEASLIVHSTHLSDFERENVRVSNNTAQSDKRFSLGGKVKYGLIFLLRACMGVFAKAPRQKHVFLNGTTNPQPIYELSGQGINRMGDFYFGYLQDEIGKDKAYHNLMVLKNYGASVQPNFSKWVKPLSNIRFYSYFESSLVGYLIINPLSLIQAFRRQKELHKWLSVRITQSIGYEKALLKQIRNQLSHISLAGIRYEAALRLLKRMSPKTVGCDDEWIHSKYPIIAAAKKLGIPTYGLQHGGISAMNANYSFTEQDLPYDPFPDLTMIWGEHTFTRLCRESSYPKHRVKMVGQVRTDVIPVLKAMPREKLISGITDDRKVILFLSQPIYHLPEIRQKMFRDVFQLQKDLSDYSVIVKPHPNESKDVEMIKSIAREVGVEADMRFDDLYGLLAGCDAAITFYSTAGAEAVYFDKELIVLDYNKVDSARYVAEGVGHPCATYDELKSTVSGLFSGKLPNLSSNRAEYRSKRLVAIDGRTRFRIIDAIEELGNRTRHSHTH